VKRTPGVHAEGYPPHLTGPLTEAEAAQMARRRALSAADDAKRGPLGAPNYRRGPSPDRTLVSGLTVAEVDAWFKTGILP
jgi:D-serine deaminase-like pyridoxal phosphate-dependent protein